MPFCKCRILLTVSTRYVAIVAAIIQFWDTFAHIKFLPAISAPSIENIEASKMHRYRFCINRKTAGKDYGDEDKNQVIEIGLISA